jgi:hypothetical protein
VVRQEEQRLKLREANKKKNEQKRSSKQRRAQVRLNRYFRS